MNVHTIRLLGPWRLEPLARYGAAGAVPDGLPEPATIRLPGDWGAAFGDDFRGRVRFCRRFNRPTGLASGDRVWLFLAGVHPRGEVRLNGQLLGEADASQPARFLVSVILQVHNELTIDIDVPHSEEAPRSPGGILTLVALEIETTPPA